MPAPATSKQGLGREARAALLRVRLGPECPKANQSELIWASKPDWDIYHVKSPKTPPDPRTEQSAEQN